MAPTQTVQHAADENGTVLYMALPMAILMIGAAWGIMGTGDLILLRTHAQEAADAAAFSSAVTHAQGMNFMAAMNVSMLALTLTYVALRYMTDTLNLMLSVGRSAPNEREDLDSTRFSMVSSASRLAVGFQTEDILNDDCANKGVNAPPYCFDRGDAAKYGCESKAQTLSTLELGTQLKPCEISKPISKAFWALAGGPTLGDVNKKIVAQFELNVVKKGLDSIAQIESVVQGVQPMVAAANSMRVTEMYKLGGVGVGLSSALVVPKPNAFSAGRERIGLPTEARTKDVLCDMSRDASVQGALAHRKDVTAPTKVRDAASAAMSRVFSRSAKDRYCSDRSLRTSFDSGRPDPSQHWRVRNPDTREPLGPQVLLSNVSGVVNGGMQFQVWGAMTLRPSQAMSDKAMAGLAMMQRTLGRRAVLEEGGANPVRSYVAQAEFYLACGNDDAGSGKWEDPECNGTGMSSFRMQWRARLRQVRPNDMSKVLSGRGAGEIEHWAASAAQGMTIEGPTGATQRVVPTELADKIMPSTNGPQFYH